MTFPGPISNNDWQVDLAHQGSFVYLPYLITGDWYFLEEMYFWAAYNIASSNPNSLNWGRHADWGRISEQVRGEAWGLRNLAHAAFLAPDGSPEQKYFTQKLNNSLAAYEGEHNITDGAFYDPTPGSKWEWGRSVHAVFGANPLHFMYEGSTSNKVLIGLDTSVVGAGGAPFVINFWYICMGHIAELGFASDKLLETVSKNLLNQILHPDYNPFLADNYRFPTQDLNGKYLTTWAEVKAGHEVSSDSSFTATYAYSYAQIAKGAASFLAGLSDGNLSGDAAYAWMKANISDQSQNDDPTWAFVPRGSLLAISVTPNSLGFGNVAVGSSAEKTFTVENTGSGTLTGNASTSAPFSIVSGGSYSLLEGESQTVTVRFSPTEEVASTGSVPFTGGGGTTKAVTGTGAPPTFTLTVIKSGSGSGTVSSSPGEINCGTDCTEDYDKGRIVTLTATPASGSTFAAWSGAGCSGTGTCMLTVNADTTVTATFNLQTFDLTVTKAGSGNGTVTSSPTGIDCGSDCTEDYVSATSVTLTANPNDGSSFKAWSGACTGTDTCTVTMSEDRSVTATYSKTFTDDPLTANATLVKASHFLEALEAINFLGQRLELGNISFTAPTPAAGVPISRNHMTTLHTGLSALYDALARTRPTFDTMMPGVTVIGKSQMEQVRNAIRALETVPTQ